MRWRPGAENIAAFGGDSARVTIFGESAGADMVNYLLPRPVRTDHQPEFICGHGADSASGSAGRIQPASGTAREQHIESRSAVSSATLRALPTEQLLAAMGERDRFTPIVDGRVLPDQPGRLFATGRQQKVPYMTGGNSWEASLGRRIGGGFSPAFAAKLVPVVDQARLYPGLSGEALDDAIFGDLVILSQSRFLADQMCALQVPVYAYYFSWVAEDRRVRQPGAAHADDIAFVMGTLDAETDLSRVTAQDQAISRLMTGYWLQFARSGNPNNPDAPDWPVYAPGSAQVLEIGAEVEVRKGFLAERMAYHLKRGQEMLGHSRGVQHLRVHILRREPGGSRWVVLTYNASRALQPL